MPKRKPKPKVKPKANRGGRITAKRVRRSENQPPPNPPGTFVPSPEPDDDPLGDDGLTIKQRQFVAALVGPAGGNATRAAEMAGYAAENRNALWATASENLRKPKVQEAIAHAYARLRLTPEWAKTTLVDVASSSMANFLSVGDDGKPYLDFAKAAAVGAMGQIKEYREEGFDVDGGSGPTIIKRSIKIHDRTTAVGLLLKFHGLLTDVESETDRQPIRVRAVDRRPKPNAGSDPKPPADPPAD